MTSEKERQLLHRLLETFKPEAAERIEAISAGLADLAAAEGPARTALIESIFREAHSLKAAAHSVGQKHIGTMCQALESVFAAAKRGEIDPPRAMLSDMQAATDVMADLLRAIDAGAGSDVQKRSTALELAIVRGLKDARSGAKTDERRAADTVAEEARPKAASATVAPATKSVPQSPAASVEPVADPERIDAVSAPETVRLSAQKLESLMRQAEEMLSEKAGVRELCQMLADTREAMADWRKEWMRIRAGLPLFEGGGAGRCDAASMRLSRFLQWSEAHLAALDAALTDCSRAAESDARRLGGKVDRLLWEVKEILTVPAASLQPVLHRAVRDLARDQGKLVDFVFRGGDLELDRRILQELKDPLLHLVRNCVDHGVERPETREAQGKPPQATISVEIALRDGDKVEFAVADDGGGVPLRRLSELAAKIGYAPALPRQDLLQVIFQSGVSTSPLITDVSGRGVGLAIVREKAERLGGGVTVESEDNRGTSFRLTVPASLATYRGIAVVVRGRQLMFPSLGVEQVIRIRRNPAETVEGRPVVSLGNGPVSMVSLADVLEIPAASSAAAPSEWIEAVVVGAAGRQIAFEVDSVESDQEILMKPLGKALVRVRNVQGATILPGGEIVPILNIHDLLKSATRAGRRAPSGATVGAAEPARQRRVLVVEDSITARGLLRSILESAGYRVKTAVDGLEAWSALRLEPFDLVVSDVEMPRMNGFDLTARIRADRQLSDMPVVLVTALESREDRERGVAAGANAYILKGGFEQSTLLEAVRRLI